MPLLLGWNMYVVGGLTVLFLVVCVMMVLTVLIQRPQGGGLAGAFGSGAGSGQTAFGAKTGDALTIFTIIVFVLFLGMGITLNFGYRPETEKTTLLKTSVTSPDGTSVPVNTPPVQPGAAPPAAPSGDAQPAAPTPAEAPAGAPAATPAPQQPTPAVPK